MIKHKFTINSSKMNLYTIKKLEWLVPVQLKKNSLFEAKSILGKFEINLSTDECSDKYVLKLNDSIISTNILYSTLKTTAENMNIAELKKYVQEEQLEIKVSI